MATLKLSIIFESGARIGPGKVQLLQSIRDTGSISAAAREMGMSYKQAWLLLDSLNAAFNKPVVAAATGGDHGGGGRLTPLGGDVRGRPAPPARLGRPAPGAPRKAQGERLYIGRYRQDRRASAGSRAGVFRPSGK